ncbi:hypothetical protein [Granulicella tundricola]|uniref:Apea-like HEPN domain-containing protein n=1 Tax=Granulicella tundricola (strain ATCC BAA-1859 / DSM 23138 / MP5ACTX9) TaxID=1198114 RepID=E8X0Y4_GRATM|nr:hypothetical protein [Granulicella tundricola]ADW70168.1 hypothetical protein AciX9_3157 [Granulicella tundricola MP5ACTX9]
MPVKLPNNKTLKKAIETKAFRKSLQFLKGKSAALAPYRSLEDLFFEIEDHNPPSLAGVEKHLQEVCWRFRKTLYAHSVFIGGSVLDQIFYDRIRDPQVVDPVLSALTLIRTVGIHKPGLILYPLHSFSLLGIALLERFTSARLEFFVTEAEVCARAQTNSLGGTIEFLERAAESFGIKRAIPVESMEHYERSRPTKWLTRNTLLAVKAHVFSNDYYENHRFIILQLERASSLLFCLASLQGGFPVLKADTLFSSTRNNNWETQDIFHFLLFEPKAGSAKKLESRCIPMNARTIELAELCSVNVGINLKAWVHRRPLMERVCKALNAIEAGYRQSNVLSSVETVMHRVFKKIMQSLRYFRRSFRYTSGDDDIVMLAVALESLLTDSYAPGGGERLKRRAGLLLKGHPRRAICVEEIGKVYYARNQVVHTAEREQDVDVSIGREAYTLCLLRLVDRLPSLPQVAGNPIQQIIGDTHADPPALPMSSSSG